MISVRCVVQGVLSLLKVLRLVSCCPDHDDVVHLLGITSSSISWKSTVNSENYLVLSHSSSLPLLYNVVTSKKMNATITCM